MKAEEILRHLDTYMDESINLLNMNYDLADTRMTIFRSDEDWVIFFEFIMVHSYCDEAGVYLYGYGNCLNKQGWLPYSRSLLDRLEPFGAFNRRRFSVFIKGKKYDFTPTDEDYSAAGIVFTEDGFDLDLCQLVLFLCYHLNHPFFSSEDFLRYVMEECGASHHKMALFFQTLEWQHPDIPDTPPSKVEYFRILAQAIETGDLSALLKIDRSTFNTDWRKVEAEKKKILGFNEDEPLILIW